MGTSKKRPRSPSPDSSDSMTEAHPAPIRTYKSKSRKNKRQRHSPSPDLPPDESSDHSRPPSRQHRSQKAPLPFVDSLRAAASSAASKHGSSGQGRSSGGTDAEKMIQEMLGTMTSDSIAAATSETSRGLKKKMAGKKGSKVASASSAKPAKRHASTGKSSTTSEGITLGSILVLPFGVTKAPKSRNGVGSGSLSKFVLGKEAPVLKPTYLVAQEHQGLYHSNPADGIFIPTSASYSELVAILSGLLPNPFEFFRGMDHPKLRDSSKEAPFVLCSKFQRTIEVAPVARNRLPDGKAVADLFPAAKKKSFADRMLIIAYQIFLATRDKIPERMLRQWANDSDEDFGDSDNSDANSSGSSESESSPPKKVTDKGKQKAIVIDSSSDSEAADQDSSDEAMSSDSPPAPKRAAKMRAQEKLRLRSPTPASQSEAGVDIVMREENGVLHYFPDSKEPWVVTEDGGIVPLDYCITKAPRAGRPSEGSSQPGTSRSHLAMSRNNGPTRENSPTMQNLSASLSSFQIPVDETLDDPWGDDRPITFHL
ncbi:hypothetical protein DFP72DRAFT_839437 [Ephemerocybe angulata]|uniref:Uncharacterized protein n=1 Tax=Ephemerocybe angulata TaxID=980116 RepID=A0A8H6IHM1_9AGAR|nr:hypothetical protein DFP72DRAFT_839437 [Tulosesus angulatus]